METFMNGMRNPKAIKIYLTERMILYERDLC